jgi:hypothetical protein
VNDFSDDLGDNVKKFSSTTELGDQS